MAERGRPSPRAKRCLNRCFARYVAREIFYFLKPLA
jgi:hypothetical protein